MATPAAFPVYLTKSVCIVLAEKSCACFVWTAYGKIVSYYIGNKHSINSESKDTDWKNIKNFAHWHFIGLWIASELLQGFSSELLLSKTRSIEFQKEQEDFQRYPHIWGFMDYSWKSFF